MELLRIAVSWETAVPARASSETRAADEEFLLRVVTAVQAHQYGSRSVPIARVGRHVVRRVDLVLARVHQQLAAVLREGADDDELAPRVQLAIASRLIGSVPFGRIAATLRRLSEGSGFRAWVAERGGPEQAAADLISMLLPRSGRYAFLVRQLLGEGGQSAMALEEAARGKLVSPRELEAYVLALLGHAPRTVRRIQRMLRSPCKCARHRCRGKPGKRGVELCAGQVVQVRGGD